MNDDVRFHTDFNAEIWSLFDAACDDALSADEVARLETLLRADERLLNLYLDYFCMHAELLRLIRLQRSRKHIIEAMHPTPLSAADANASLISETTAEVKSAAAEPKVTASTPGMLPDYELPWEKPRPKVVIKTSPPTPILWYSVNSPIGLPLISYTLGALIMLIALSIGAVVHVTHNYEIAVGQAATSEDESGGSGGGGGLSGALAAAEKAKPKKEEAPVVGHISGMVDCRWADPSLKPLAPRIRQGTKFALVSGLMEITYTTGAKVILQGPCTYEVESPHGGYLALGKLTARVASGQWPVASAQSQIADHKSAIRNHKSHSPLATRHSPLFTVRTPTALITDLGTEFGVEVDENRNTISHVFQGYVGVRLAGDVSGDESRVVVLGANQSALVKKDGKIQTFDAAKRARAGEEGVVADAAGAFVRQMPRWTPIKVFNTGIGLKEGDPDPHWQIVARSDQPDFKPQPAVVTSVRPELFRPNDPGRSQWISIAGNLPDLPNGVTFTFRTTFELKDATPGSAVLRCQFLADNHVSDIRLNGEAVKIPWHSYFPPFDRFTPFAVNKGFVKGTNVLEIEVHNEDIRPRPAAPNPMAVLVELELSALSWPDDAETADGGHGSGERKETKP